MNAITPILREVTAAPAAAPREWHNCLAAQRLLQAIVTLDGVGKTLQPYSAGPAFIMSDAADAVGGIARRTYDNGIPECTGEMVWAPSGAAITALWDALDALRGEHIAVQMLEAGIERRWMDYWSGERLERALEHFDRFDRDAASISDALDEALVRFSRCTQFRLETAA